MTTLAQTIRSFPGPHTAKQSERLLPAPKTKGQAIGYAVGGAFLLLAIFALVIWLKRDQ
jgi:hypothetical protein